MLECELCKSWQMVDALTYRFQLREGVRWHAIAPVNGRELTAGDLVFSYRRQLTPGWANAPLLQDLQTVEAEGPYTLKLTLNPAFPNADFLVSLADGHSKVVAKEVLDVWGGLDQAPVIGSGPWIWKSTQEDVGSVLTRNGLYFEPGLPFLDELVIRVIRSDEETRLAAFLTGAVDVYRVSPAGWQQLSETPAKRFNSSLSLQGGSGVVLTMNTSRPPFDNPQVRTSVLRALDPWSYLGSLWKGQGFVSLGVPVVQPDWNLTMEEMRGPYFANPTEARRLLAGSGAAGPVKFELTVADFGDIHLALGKRLGEDLRSVGFEPSAVRVGSSQYQDRVWRDKDYQMAVGELPPTSTPNSFLFGILHSGSASGNVVRHSDPGLDALIVQQAVERDPSRRRELIRKVQLRLLEQAYMFSPVTSGVRWVYRPEVSGFFPNTAASDYFYWAKTWLE
jgi:peptide/nickel transport system substrate-binding protein